MYGMIYKGKKLNYSRFVSSGTKKDVFVNHVHPNYELLFVFSGEGSFIIEDTEYAVKENTLFLIPPGKYHVMNIENRKDYDRCVINFDASLLPSFFEKRTSLHQITDDKVRTLADKMEEYCGKYNEEALEILFSCLLSEILITAVYDEGETAERNDVPPLVKNAIEYIKSNLDRQLSVESVAEGLFVSKTHLAHIFSQTLGVGIMHYVAIKKAYKARSLLRKGKSVTEVCEALGYTSYTTFLRNYRTHFGINPSEENVKA